MKVTPSHLRVWPSTWSTQPSWLSRLCLVPGSRCGSTAAGTAVRSSSSSSILSKKAAGKGNDLPWDDAIIIIEPLNERSHCDKYQNKNISYNKLYEITFHITLVGGEALYSIGIGLEHLELQRSKGGWKFVKIFDCSLQSTRYLPTSLGHIVQIFWDTKLLVERVLK